MEMATPDLSKTNYFNIKHWFVEPKRIIVDQHAVEATAKSFSTGNDATACNPVMMKRAVHDVMLECWDDVAKEIQLWLKNITRVAESARLSQ